ncbi:glutathione S-transferase family protein [Thalassotalea crassostreae]|uniref:glutathione S-transferase family protein n=1 Tax=Thalassotalea crassostreae TaxID=1763536 RepID=UPI0008389911|nr:glutathione S-transferase family protein [Thalassotalea crassostreae]
MKLYGSTTSPYVRRIRIFTHSIELDFHTMDIFSPAGRKELVAKNPTLKVPFLVDDEQYVFDSRVIYRYLTDKFELSAITWNEENQLTLIDAVNDSLVQMFILSNSGINTGDDALYFKLQRERADMVFSELDEQCRNGDFDTWHYPSISLYCLLDWAQFREQADIEKFPALVAFLQKHRQREDVIATDPRA